MVRLVQRGPHENLSDYFAPFAEMCLYVAMMPSQLLVFSMRLSMYRSRGLLHLFQELGMGTAKFQYFVHLSDTNLL